MTTSRKRTPPRTRVYSVEQANAILAGAVLVLRQQAAAYEAEQAQARTPEPIEARPQPVATKRKSA